MIGNDEKFLRGPFKVLVLYLLIKINFYCRYGNNETMIYVHEYPHEDRSHDRSLTTKIKRIKCD